MSGGVTQRVPLALRLVLLGASLAGGVSWVVVRWNHATSLSTGFDSELDTLLTGLWVLLVILVWLVPAALVVQLLARTVYRGRATPQDGTGGSPGLSDVVAPITRLGGSLLSSKLGELAWAVRVLAFFSAPLPLTLSAVYWSERPSRASESFVGVAGGVLWLGAAALVSYWGWSRWRRRTKVALVAVQLFVLIGAAGIGYRLHRAIARDQCDGLYRCVRLIFDD